MELPVIQSYWLHAGRLGRAVQLSSLMLYLMDYVRDREGKPLPRMPNIQCIKPEQPDQRMAGAYSGSKLT